MLMINYLASIVDNFGDKTFARFVQAGLPVALLGILTVFAVLSLIWGCLEVLKYFFYTVPEMRKKAESEESAAPVQSAPVQAQASYTNDEEIVAAIIAAITAARADEGVSPSVPFRVVSFRKRK